MIICDYSGNQHETMIATPNGREHDTLVFLRPSLITLVFSIVVAILA